MVMLTYAAEAGHTFYDRRLYLPTSWTGDPERLRDAGVPDEIAFATKPRLGIAMLHNALDRNLPFSWVAAGRLRQEPGPAGLSAHPRDCVRARGTGHAAIGRTSRQAAPAERGQSR